MAEYEIVESEFVRASDVKNVEGLTIEIISEIKPTQTNFGVKPQGRVKISNGIETHEKTMQFNQATMNELIKKDGEKNSIKWIGYKFVPKVDEVKGNLAIFVKEFV